MGMEASIKFKIYSFSYLANLAKNVFNLTQNIPTSTFKKFLFEFAKLLFIQSPSAFDIFKPVPLELCVQQKIPCYVIIHQMIRRLKVLEDSISVALDCGSRLLISEKKTLEKTHKTAIS